MGKFNQQSLARKSVADFSRAHANRRAPVLEVAKDNSLIAGLHLMPNCDHYVRISLPGDAREIHLSQNQMKMLVEFIKEAHGHIVIDDGHTDRLRPGYVPLGAGGRF